MRVMNSKGWLATKSESLKFLLYPFLLFPTLQPVMWSAFRDMQ